MSDHPRALALVSLSHSTHRLQSPQSQCFHQAATHSPGPCDPLEAAVARVLSTFTVSYISHTFRSLLSVIYSASAALMVLLPPVAFHQYDTPPKNIQLLCSFFGSKAAFSAKQKRGSSATITDSLKIRTCIHFEYYIFLGGGRLW